MIVIIDNYDSFTYNLYQAILPFEVDVRVFRNNRISVQELVQLHPDAIVLSPGPGRPEQAGICIDLIRAAAMHSIPLLGVCLGHQAIASAFGCSVVQAPEIMHGKAEMIFHQRRGLYHKMPLPFPAGRYHSLVADRSHLSDEFIIEAENAAGLIMGIRHKKYPIYGVQFHPESILTPNGNLLLQNFIESTRKICV
jgi:anthranilate synthase component 2